MLSDLTRGLVTMLSYLHSHHSSHMSWEMALALFLRKSLVTLTSSCTSKCLIFVSDAFSITLLLEDSEKWETWPVEGNAEILCQGRAPLCQVKED